VGAGGYSDDNRFANNTEFMLRALFSLRCAIDGVYYLRHRHGGGDDAAGDGARYDISGKSENPQRATTG
jgi:hypothetical protein